MSPAEETLTPASVVSAENPWPGLLSFREADQRWFQGRGEETADLLHHVKRERLCVLFALSGLGKSSLLQAGLFPALRREGIFPVHVRLDYAAANPDLGGQVLDAIYHAASAADVAAPSARHGESLWEYFHHIQCEFWTRQQQRVLPLLVFDQFEEIFTLGRAEGRAQVSEAFLDDLADLAEDSVPAEVGRRWAANPALQDDYSPESAYKLLISLREDFLAELSDQHRRIAAVPQKRYRLRQMNGAGAQLAVSQARDLADEAVAAQIVRYVAGERSGGGRRVRELADLDVEPALLSVVCRELNSRRRQRGERKITPDLLEGDQEEILNDFYDHSFQGLAPAVRAFVEEHLITVAGARNSVPLDNALAAPGISTQVLDQLVERRLLRKEFRRNEVRLELTHDLLTGIVRARRDARRREEAAELERKERQEALQKARRSRVLAGAFGAIALVALGAAGVALRANRIANDRSKDLERAFQIERELRASDQKKTVELQVANENVRKEADNAARSADLQAQAALEASQQAQLARDRALSEATAKEKAQKSEATAKESEALAKKAEAKAELEATAAKKSAAAEAVARDAAQKKQKEADEANQKNLRESAKGMLTDASVRIDAGQPAIAMAYIARSLRADPAAVAARSWAFDQLLRGKWTKEVSGADTGAAAFVHPEMGHSGQVLSASFSPDGRQLVTGSTDGVVRIWDWRSGALVRQFKAHVSWIAWASFSPDGRRILTASVDKTARVWEAADGAQVFVLQHSGIVKSAVYSSDGQKVLTTSADTARIWNAGDGSPAGIEFKHTSPIHFAAFHPRDSRTVVLAGADGVAQIRRAGGGVVQIPPHSREVLSAVFSPDGGRVLTASADGTARVWRVSEKSVTPAGDTMRHGGPVEFAVFSPDGRRIATASRTGSARLWDASSPEVTGRPIGAPIQHGGRVARVAFSQDGRRLSTASGDGKARVFEVWYDFDNPEEVATLLEVAGGYAGSEGYQPLPPADRDRRRQDLKSRTGRQPATSFLRWLVSHRL